MPAGVTPAKPVGRWIPKDATDSAAFMEFTGTTYGASTGCSSVSGRWLEGDKGRITILSLTASPILYCVVESNVTNWVPVIRRVGMVGSELRLYDTNGKELGALVRDTSSR